MSGPDLTGAGGTFPGWGEWWIAHGRTARWPDAGGDAESPPPRPGADAKRIGQVERRAERPVGVSFAILAAYVAFEAMRNIADQEHAAASPVGIVLTAVSIGVMIWLARAKRETGDGLGSRALVADTHQTYACWYLSGTTLAGLALNAMFGLWWADPVAALLIAVLLVREAREASEGEEDHD